MNSFIFVFYSRYFSISALFVRVYKSVFLRISLKEEEEEEEE